MFSQIVHISFFLNFFMVRDIVDVHSERIRHQSIRQYFFLVEKLFQEIFGNFGVQ